MRDPAPPDGPWLADFALPELDMLVSQPPVLDADFLSQWLGTSGDPPGAADVTPPLDLTSSGDGSSGTNTTKSLSKEEERLERARALNRAKQTRFRQRQKERKEQLAAQYEQAAAELEREQDLNERMRQSCAALENIKVQKDAVVEVLEAAKREDAAPADTTGKQIQVVGGGLPALNLREQLWALPFRERLQLCSSIFSATPQVQATLTERAGCMRKADGRVDGFALDLETKKRLARHMATHQPEMLQAAISMSPESLIKEWGELGELSAEVLAAYDAGEIDEEGVEERMCRPVMYFSVLGAALLCHKPETLQALLQHSSYPGESEEEKTARWNKVALGMGVTAEQAQPMVAMWQTYCDRMDELDQGTQASLTTLREVQQNLSAYLLDKGLSAAVSDYLRVFEAAGRLNFQANAALFITYDFMSATGTQVTPLQKTRMIAMSRPLHPDCVAIVREGLASFGILPERPCKAGASGAGGAGGAPVSA